eukprot:75448_1
MASLQRFFKISAEVQSALDNHLPIVALESTIITHGMPYPQNYHTAKSVENTIRSLGVTPATIAIISGIIHVGLNESEIQNLSQLDNKLIYKCTRRTLPYVLSNKYHGSTTVAATMYIAHLCGIPIFVTGGIGGVHRGVEETMDISADLIELSHTPVTVVCAGIKSILDIRKTLEYLETHGVTATTLKQNNFPAFFMSDSKIKSPLKSNTITEIASMIQVSKALRLNNGILVAVPNDFDKTDEFVMNIERATDTALREIKEKKITGRDITPYILGRVHELTKGQSLDANIQLIHNNARIGAQIALKLYQNHNGKKVDVWDKASVPSDVLVVGGCVVDVIGSPNHQLMPYTSNPGRAQTSYGGTGRNISECLAKLDRTVTMLSAVGDDVFGHKVIQYCNLHGIDTSNIVRSEKHSTSSYVAIFDKNNDLFISIADLAVLDEELNAAYFCSPKIRTIVKSAKFIVLDGNLSADALKMIVTQATDNDENVKIWYEPISVEKAKRIVDEKGRILPGITYISPNEMELFALLKEMRYPNGVNMNHTSMDEYVKYCKYMIHHGIKNVILTMGSKGVLVVDQDMKHTHVAVNKLSPEQIQNTNGAGDNLCGATVCGLLQGDSLVESVVKYGIQASRLCLQSKRAVHKGLSRQSLEKIRSNL